MVILAGDIGGTNTRLGVFDLRDGRVHSTAFQTYPSKEHESLDEIVGKFLAQHRGPVGHVCFAIAGPVYEGRVATTNLAWQVDARRLAALLEVGRVTLINDLEAVGYGLGQLGPDDLVTLNAGAAAAAGNQAIIAAGTGLGEAGCYWDGAQHRPYATEGGHTDFAPRSELEMELLRYLLTKFDRVSYERILSGSGLFGIYEFLHHTGRGHEPESLTETLYQQAHPAPIVRAALEGRSERCGEALALFVSIYGAEAGNLALKTMARGGVYLGGGIAPRIVPKLKEPAFMEAFLAKGRMRPLLQGMPVRVILNDTTGLIGAARYAARVREA